MDSTPGRRSVSADTGRNDSDRRAPGRLKQVAFYTTNLNGDSIPDTLRLYSMSGDTTSYNMITVTLAGFGSQTFRTEDPWTKIDEYFEDTALNTIFYPDDTTKLPSVWKK